MLALKVALFALFVTASLGQDAGNENNGKTEVEPEKTEVKPETAAGHYGGYDGYFDDSYEDYGLYDDDYWYGYEPYWPGFSDFWGYGGRGRHHHRRGRSGSSSSSSSSSSESRGRSRESRGDRDDDKYHGDKSEKRCPRPRQRRNKKSCKAVKIGTRFNGTLQAEVGEVAHGGSVKVKCSGGLELRDDNAKVNDVTLKCHDGKYKPSIDSDKLKELHCEKVPKCFPPRKLFLPIQNSKYSVDLNSTLANEADEQPVGTSVKYRCGKIGGRESDTDLPEYTVWFYDKSKLIVVDPPSPGPYMPILNFTCNADGIWQTSHPNGREVVLGEKESSITDIGLVTYGGVFCEDFVPASARDD